MMAITISAEVLTRQELNILLKKFVRGAAEMAGSLMADSLSDSAASSIIQLGTIKMIMKNDMRRLIITVEDCRVGFDLDLELS